LDVRFNSGPKKTKRNVQKKKGGFASGTIRGGLVWFQWVRGERRKSRKKKDKRQGPEV